MVLVLYIKTVTKDYCTCMGMKIWGWIDYQTRLKGVQFFLVLYVQKMGYSYFLGLNYSACKIVFLFWHSLHVTSCKNKLCGYVAATLCPRPTLTFGP